MTKRADSAAAKVTNYFMKNPDALPAVVAAKFGAGKGNVYTYRKRALAALQPKEAKVLFSKKTIEEALALPVHPNGSPPELGAVMARGKPNSSYGYTDGNGTKRVGVWVDSTPTTTDSWANHGTFLSRDEYRGYLRGRVVDLMRDGLQENFAEAMRCADKLTQLAKTEGQ